MTNDDLTTLRQRAYELQEEELRLAEEFVPTPDAIELINRTMGSKMLQTIQRSHALHRKMADLVKGRDLESIHDMQCLEEVVSLQQELVDMHTENTQEMRRILNQKGGLN